MNIVWRGVEATEEMKRGSGIKTNKQKSYVQCCVNFAMNFSLCSKTWVAIIKRMETADFFLNWSSCCLLIIHTHTHTRARIDFSIEHVANCISTFSETISLSQQSISYGLNIIYKIDSICAEDLCAKTWLQFKKWIRAMCLFLSRRQWCNPTLSTVLKSSNAVAEVHQSNGAVTFEMNTISSHRTVLVHAFKFFFLLPSIWSRFLLLLDGKC